MDTMSKDPMHGHHVIQQGSNIHKAGLSCYNLAKMLFIADSIREHFVEQAECQDRPEVLTGSHGI